jgi:catechol 2,3-dioxygenase-like lactoylglutathione lyase family enzyme
VRKLARAILFTGRMDAMSKFYGEVLGLKQVTGEKGWREFAAGGATFGRVRQQEVLCLCDGQDPDGNPIQLPNR